MPKVIMQNQAPFDFSDYVPKLTRFDNPLEDELQDALFKNLLAKMKTPVNNTAPIKIMVDGKEYKDDEIINDLTKSVAEEDVNIPRDEILSLLFHQSSRYRGKHPENWKQIIGNSILLKNKAPLPTASMLYTYNTDIQNQAKDFLMNDTPQTRTELLIGLIGNLIANTISDRWCFILTNNSDYDRIKDELDKEIQTFTTDPAIQGFNRDVQGIAFSKDDCFTSWVTGNNVLPGSLNRFILDTLEAFKPSGFTETLPLNIQGILNPIGFAFINVEALANSDQLSYQHELKQLQSVSNNLRRFKISKLSKIKNATNYSSSAPHYQKQYTKTMNGIGSRKQRGFHKTLPSTKWQLSVMSKLIKKRTSKIISDTTYKSFITSFMRANRRHPNDPNLRGRLQKTNYRPDIHIYLDSSGSISERQYRTAVTLLICISKKLKTNLYFTSFSHVVSQPVKLNTKNASVKQIYRQIQLVPKVTGGTEYENVWRMIDVLEKQNRYHQLSPQLNFMITDFEYNISSTWNPQLNKASTQNTYYVPLAATQDEYNRVKSYGMDFANQLIDKGDITIKSRMIM
jgi:hypothetical protein